VVLEIDVRDLNLKSELSTSVASVDSSYIILYLVAAERTERTMTK
jgi:hypothetical protein